MNYRCVAVMAVMGANVFAGCGEAQVKDGSGAADANPSQTPAAKPGAAAPAELDAVATGLALQPIYTFAQKTVAFNPDGTLLAAGNGDGVIRIWTVADGRLALEIQAHDDWAFSVAFSPDGRLLASAGGDNLVKVWDVATGEKKHELAGHTDDVHGVVFLGGDKRLASGGDDRMVRIWDLSSGKSSVLSGHTRQVTAVAVSPDGKLLASASRDATIRLWDAKTGKEVGTPKKHRADVLDLAFNHDGSRMVSASYDQTARLWNVETGKRLQTFSGRAGWVFAVAISPDGKNLATGAGDTKLRLWAMEGGDPQHVIKIGAVIAALDYAPDGKTLAAALTDGTVQLFDLSGESPRRSTRLGTPNPGLKKNRDQQSPGAQTKSALTPQEYLDLHVQVMKPGGDDWKLAVARLADLGDGFTIQLLQDVDEKKLSPEDRTLLANTAKTVSKRIANEDAAQVAAAIQSRLERAATADLQCHAFEGRLVRWAFDSIRSFARKPEVSRELERIRDRYESNAELGFGSLRNRVRAYAARLLKGERGEATR